MVLDEGTKASFLLCREASGEYNVAKRAGLGRDSS
jgi:hypothetical protein